MAKRFILLLSALSVLAVAAPSMASATSKLTEGGALVPVGSSLVNTGSDVTLTSNLLGAITCEKLTLNDKVTVNNGSEVKASGVKEKPGQTGCKNGTKPVVITEFEIIEIYFGNPTLVYITFFTVIDIGSGEAEVRCTFTGEKVPGTYTSGTGTVTLNSGSVVKGSPAKCGTAKLTGTFSLETSNGTGLILD